MLAKETLKFLKDLKANNDRDWFKANKALFDKAQDNMTAFIGQLIGSVGKFDTEVNGIDPTACVFRIYRDVRFSKDKSPYKTNLGGYISPGGRKSMQPGFYFHLEPGKSFFAAGKHLPDGKELLKIRNAIAANADAFLKIVNKKSFIEKFGKLSGDSLRSVPKGFDPESKAAEYLKLKDLMVVANFTNDKDLLSADLAKNINALAKEAYPLISFLRTALDQ